MLLTRLRTTLEQGIFSLVAVQSVEGDACNSTDTNSSSSDDDHEASSGVSSYAGIFIALFRRRLGCFVVREFARHRLRRATRCEPAAAVATRPSRAATRLPGCARPRGCAGPLRGRLACVDGGATHTP